MKNFDLYAQYYDLLYKDKRYDEEILYIDSLIRKNNTGAKEILNLGCGTGKHDHFLAKKGYKVDGIDLSEEMIQQARQNFGANPDLHFEQGNITGWRHCENKRYDVVISLFHVMSYLTENTAVADTFKTAFMHLKPGGVFIYDCWYGPGVFNDKPTVRVKRLENENIKVQRISEPVQHVNSNVVDVHFDVQIQEKKTNSVSALNEVHKMRYFFIPELSAFADGSGFAGTEYYEWLKDTPPGDRTWNIVAVQKRPSP